MQMDIEKIFGRPKTLAELLGWVVSNAKKIAPPPVTAKSPDSRLCDSVEISLTHLRLLNHCLGLLPEFIAKAKLDEAFACNIYEATVATKKLLEPRGIYAVGVEAEILSLSP